MPAGIDITDELMRARQDEVAEELRRVWSTALDDIQTLIHDLETGELQIDDFPEIENQFRERINQAGDEARELLNEAVEGEFGFGLDAVEDIPGISTGETPPINTSLLTAIQQELNNSITQAEQNAFQVASTYTNLLRQAQLQALIL